MKFKILSRKQLFSDLFIPFLGQSSHWAGLALNGQIIQGFQLQEQDLFLEQKIDNATESTLAYFEALPELSFIQKLMLLSSPAFPHFFDVELALQKMSMGRSLEELQKMAAHLKNFPQNFLFWAHEKGLHFFDLAPTLSLSSIHSSTETLQAQLQNLFLEWPHFSKSQGTQILELLVELLLMGHPTEILKNQLGSQADQSLKNLKQLRYPETHQRDAETKKESLYWPQIVQAQGQRQGDRWGYRLNFFVSNPHELNKTVEQLQKAAEEWKNQN